MRTTAAVAIALVAVGAASMSPAVGAPKKITKSYTATAPVPDPTNAAGGDYTVAEDVARLGLRH